MAIEAIHPIKVTSSSMLTGRFTIAKCSLLRSTIVPMSRDRLLQPTPVALLSLGIVAALLLVDVMQLTRLGEVRAYADRTAPCRSRWRRR